MSIVLAAAAFVLQPSAAPVGPPAPEVILPAEDSDQRLADLRWQRDTKAAWTEEWVFQGLNVVDAATTCAIIAEGGEEKNPLYGSHPSCGKVVGIKAGLGLVHYLLSRHMIHENPHGARKGLIVSGVLQLAVDVWNVTQLAK